MTKTFTLNIAVLGVGAMGSLFGSRLNDLAHVTLIGNWVEQIETVQRDGLAITYPDGHQTQHALRFTNNLAEVPPADLALILVKGYQTARAARQAAQVLKPNGLAITLQNGLGNLEILAEAVGPRRARLKRGLVVRRFWTHGCPSIGRGSASCTTCRSDDAAARARNRRCADI